IEVIERPVRGWRLWLLVGMLALLAACIAVPFTRDFFALAVPAVGPLLAGVAVGGVVWAALGLVARLTRPREPSA
ncbi:MAG: hypothetical protein WCP28_05525, partial [Actinomycetes bacterium]